MVLSVALAAALAAAPARARRGLALAAARRLVAVLRRAVRARQLALLARLADAVDARAAARRPTTTSPATTWRWRSSTPAGPTSAIAAARSSWWRACPITIWAAARLAGLLADREQRAGDAAANAGRLRGRGGRLLARARRTTPARSARRLNRGMALRPARRASARRAGPGSGRARPVDRSGRGRGAGARLVRDRPRPATPSPCCGGRRRPHPDDLGAGHEPGPAAAHREAGRRSATRRPRSQIAARRQRRHRRPRSARAGDAGRGARRHRPAARRRSRPGTSPSPSPAESGDAALAADLRPPTRRSRPADGIALERRQSLHVARRTHEGRLRESRPSQCDVVGSSR